MAFVKLDDGLLQSTVWEMKPDRDVWITCLLMARPKIFAHALKEIAPDSTKETGFELPAGTYGFIAASGPGICRAAIVDRDAGLKALQRFTEPEAESRSAEYEGRRLIRVSGGYVVLNYMPYREKGSSGAERTRNWRKRQQDQGLFENVTSQGDAKTSHVTQAEDRSRSREEKKLAESSPDGDLPLAIGFSLCDGSRFHPTATQLAKWRLAYPAVNIDQEFAKMDAWSESKPRERKTRTGAPAFVNRWLDKAQNDTNRNAPRGAPARHEEDTPASQRPMRSTGKR